MKNCKYIFLVGGFANSVYFQKQIKRAFKDITVVIPELPQLCVVDGAARYGLKPRFVKIRRLAHTYGIKVNKLTNAVDESKFPKGFIKEHVYMDKVENREIIGDCFSVFAVKNKQITINDEPVIKDVYKIIPTQKKAIIEIFESDKEEPKTCLTKDDVDGNEYDATNIGHFEVLFDSKTGKLWVEFDFSDTMLSVYAYPDGHKRTLDSKVEVDYE